MQKTTNRKHRGRSGYILTGEVLLLGSLLLFGLIAGLIKLHNSVGFEFGDVAESIGTMDQSYAFTGLQGDGVIAGSAWADSTDATDNIPIETLEAKDEGF